MNNLASTLGDQGKLDDVQETGELVYERFAAQHRQTVAIRRHLAVDEVINGKTG